jgi:hypothetical protein
VALLRSGTVTPFDLIKHMGVAAETVYAWRRRAGIRTAAARAAHVRMLFERKPRRVVIETDEGAAPF